MLISHPAGNYQFLPGIAPYSCGVVAKPGFEIVHVRFLRPQPYRAGFEQVAEFLDSQDRPKAALCGIELRSPAPFSFEGFAQFNSEYAAILKDWGLFVDDLNPIARTNVAPERNPPPTPVLEAFSYTRPVPKPSSTRRTFVVAGAGELPEGILSEEEIVALGDTSAAGIREKVHFVMDLMTNRLHGLGADWPAVTMMNVFTIHPLKELIDEEILGRTGNPGVHDIRWHWTRPPIINIEFEMNLRGVQTELCLDA